ncbi:MAG: RES family NAD+ phosphorylase, partial [Microbacterium sp.]|nr:RES family NAD+ phosphorylase [Microbacterium sp.]
FVTMPAGTLLFRARFQPAGKVYRTAGELGPPPVDFATQTNRMSPPGIVMTYVSEDRATALAETVNGRGTYAIGEFLTERPALILDLSNLPPTPSIFAEIPDSYPYDPRPRIGFLQSVSREISRSIARDDRVHVEYVPTQVVTEYVRAVLTIDGRNVDGIRYRSSRNWKKTAMVLFADRNNLVLERGEQGEWYGLNRDRWLRLDKASSKRVLKLPT